MKIQAPAQHQDPDNFIETQTRLSASPLVPEIQLHQASEDFPIWKMSEEELADHGIPSPFWAFAWAGGQAISRYLLDNPAYVRGKRILDFGAGSGIIAIAALKAGAASAYAADIDPFAKSACYLNAKANNVELTATTENLIGSPNKGWDIVLVGDMCYEQPLAGQIEEWLRGLVAQGTEVLIGDPGRTYLPKSGMEKQATYRVQTSRALEDLDVGSTKVWKLLASR